MHFVRPTVLALIASLGAAGTVHAQSNTAQERARQTPPQQDSRVPQSRSPEAQFPQNVTWTAINVGGRTIDGTRRPSFILDGNFRMRGFGGCNSFSATAYPLRGQSLAVGPIALTKMACDKTVMDFERDFLTALRGSQKWTIEEGNLVLQTQRGVLRFERAL